jgi:hypothetical protein
MLKSENGPLKKNEYRLQKSPPLDQTTKTKETLIHTKQIR